MPKSRFLARYYTIIKKLNKGPATYEDIRNSLVRQFDLIGYDYADSKRTFQRDLTDIRRIFNIDISFDSAEQRYRLDWDEDPVLRERILEAFNLVNALSLSDKLKQYIDFEKRQPWGMENLYELLSAIITRKQVEFFYQKYGDTNPTQRLVEPLALKEFKNRWYVLAKDLKDNNIKSFALDRLSSLEKTRNSFSTRHDFDVNEYYQDCFGIVGPNDDHPQEVIISCNTLKGKYFKSLPLHKSQKILIDNNHEVRLNLFLYITFDFIIEILSHGDDIKVISPNSLITKLKVTYQNALNQYK